MNRNVVIGIIVVIVLILLGVAFMGNNDANDALENNENETSGSVDTSTLIVAENAVNVEAQRPGSTATVSSVMVEDRGFVVVHESVNGAPGKVLGSSSLLVAGQTLNVSLPLTEALKDGQKYIAMVHIDNGDGVFSEATDPAAKDSMGNIIMMEFEGDADASASGSVSM